MSEEMKNEKVQETMEDFAAELEASYKEYDERRNQAYVADETPDAEKWQEVKQHRGLHHHRRSRKQETGSVCQGVIKRAQRCRSERKDGRVQSWPGSRRYR